MYLFISLVSTVFLPVFYLLGRRNERRFQYRRMNLALERVFERSFLNRTHRGRCHERL